MYTSITSRLLLLAVCTNLAAISSATADEMPRRPNIVFMLSDNLGYGELGAYGGGPIRGVPTPSLDQLAAEGTRFTNFNVEPECTPSRSALMTGRLPIRSGTGRAGIPGFPQGLAPWEYTMAEMLSDAGYKTAIFGKWHLGDSQGRYPTDQGFDEWWGFPFSTGVVYRYDAQGYQGRESEWPYILSSKRNGPVQKIARYDREMRGKMDELIAEKSINYIKQAKGSEEPFFLFVSWSLMHHPYVPNPDFKGKTGVGDFADMMAEHDYRVGQIRKALVDAGFADNTIIVYASDNGPDASEYPTVSNSGPYRGYLGSAYEGSIRTPMIMSAPGVIPSGRETNEIVSILDFFPTFASLADATFPTDRAYDGVDQRDFFLGKSEKSNREHIITFLDKKLLAVKWRQFKLFFVGDDPSPTSRMHHDLYGHMIFDIEKDPREEVDIMGTKLWIIPQAYEPVLRLAGSLYKYGGIKTGDDYRTPLSFTIPPALNSPEEVKRVLLKLQQQQGANKDTKETSTE